MFPIDEQTTKYMRLTGRSEEQIALVEAYAKAQGMWLDENTPEATYSEYLEPGPFHGGTLHRRVRSVPRNRILLSEAKQQFRN